MARMPRTQSIPAWASYLADTGLSVSEAGYRTTNSEMKEWLVDNEEEIIEAMSDVVEEEEDESEVAVATFVTPAEIIEEPEEDAPARGERV